MEKVKLTEYEMLLAKERELRVDLENIVEQMTKTIVALTGVRKKISRNRHLYVIRGDE